jgi:NAD(P)H dehydrogenase (quinone)
MTIAVTGATGGLGRHTVEALLRNGLPAADVIAIGRRTGTLADLAARGVTVRQAAYDDPAALRAALAGADRLLFISGSEIGQRVAQHTNVIDAAKAAGVRFIAYTSVPRADTTKLLVAAEHRVTEAALHAAGIPFALLRNGWYFENWTVQLPLQLEHGVVGAAGAGRVSGAARADYAEAAALVVAADPAPAGAVYELGGEAFTLADYAAAVSAAVGRTVPYTDVPLGQYRDILVGAGLPEPIADVVADAERGIAEGELYVDTADLEKLLGRPATTLADAVSAAVRALG